MDVLIAYAVPVFLVCVALEWWLTARAGKNVYERRDTVASLAMGLGSAVVGLGFKFGFVALLALLYEHRLFEFGQGPVAWVALLFAEDFCYYWSHRMNHERRFMWASHVNHHSSQHYHLATALRQSWVQPFTTFMFWLPLALLGFHPLMIVAQQAVSLIYQFFIHTEQVRTLGPLEWFLNTPSHHRVHHAVNERYLDRNHAGILIIWDRLFGTFVAERADDPPVYGITKNIDTFNPVRIAFHEWASMLRDVRNAKGLGLKLALLWNAPGWEPAGGPLGGAPHAPPPPSGGTSGSEPGRAA